MTIYISIPMTGKDMNMQKIKSRIWQSIFSNSGYKVINPFYLSKYLDLLHRRKGLKSPTYDEYLDFDLKALEDCTHIFLCDGWTESRGCMAEVDRAIELGLKVFTERNFKYR